MTQADNAATSDGLVTESAVAQARHHFVWKPNIGGWGIVMCTRCLKHFKYRPMGYVTEYPSIVGCRGR